MDAVWNFMTEGYTFIIIMIVALLILVGALLFLRNRRPEE
jgi:LPXTG-motif cell wall-anchored protein